MELDLDHFARRGFVRVPGALDPELTRRWHDDALERVRALDQVRDWLPRTPKEELSTLDSEDPTTWRWRRATLDGRRRVKLAVGAPAVWEGICALLGGEQRVFTRSITDYLILGFPSRGTRRWKDRIRDRLFGSDPRAGAAFHLDDPGPAMNLDSWTNALLLVVLYSDIAPGGGGTLLACDSPPRVARRLLQGEADFTGKDEAASLVRKCSDFEEVTGRAGDILLLHPFLLHSPTTNRSDVVRVLANPMIRVNSPLHFAPESEATSPLEEITRSWVC